MDTYRTAMNKSRIGNGHIMEQQWTSLGLAVDTCRTAVEKSRIGNGHIQNSNGHNEQV